MALATVEPPIEDLVETRTEWQLAWRQLKKHRLALVGGVVLILMYLLAIFADFIAPYTETFSDRSKNYHPPTRIHFRDIQGKLHRPFVYNYTYQVKEGTYLEDSNVRHPIYLFSRGAVHQLLFFIPVRTHLFGTDPKGRIFLMGTDQFGRDVFSRILYGSRISLSIGLVGITITYFLGLLLGGISGFFAGQPLRCETPKSRTALIILAVCVGILLEYYAAGTCLFCGLLPSAFPLLLGKILISGFLGISVSLLIFVPFVSRGLDIDNLMQRFGELMMGFPQLYLLLAMAAVLTKYNLPSTTQYLLIIVILSLVRWPGVARIIRGMVLSIRERDFVSAARALGCSNLTIIGRHILPNTFSQVIVLITLVIPYYILSESALSFLALGIKEPLASWGNMLTAAKDLTVIAAYPWMLVPGVFIFATVLAFNLLGDGLRDALDPKMRI